MEDLSGLPEYSDRWKTMEAPPKTPIAKCYKIGLIGPFDYDVRLDPQKIKQRLFEYFGEVDSREGISCLVTSPVNSGVPSIGWGMATYGIRMQIVGIGVKDKATMDVDMLIIEGTQWGDEAYTFANFIDELLVVGSNDHVNRIANMVRLAFPDKKISYA